MILGSPFLDGSFTFDFDKTVRESYEAVASAAGFRVIFDERFRDSGAGAIKLKNIDVTDALDFLSLQTRSLWQPTGGDTILVAPNAQTVRRELFQDVTKTIKLSTFQSSDLDEVVTLLRTILNIRQVSAFGDSIVMADMAPIGAFAELLIANLDSPH
jgi:hypothetical protein